MLHLFKGVVYLVIFTPTGYYLSLGTAHVVLSTLKYIPHDYLINILNERSVLHTSVLKLSFLYSVRIV